MCFGFVRDVHHVGDRHLHAERQFVLRDSGERFRIAECIGLQLIQIIDGIERQSTACRDPCPADR